MRESPIQTQSCVEPPSTAPHPCHSNLPAMWIFKIVVRIFLAVIRPRIIFQRTVCRSDVAKLFDNKKGLEKLLSIIRESML
jgi:hypothetical protein